MISQYDVQKLTDLILENRDALNRLHTATTEQKMQAAYEFANTDRELFTFVGLLASQDEHPMAADADGWIEWRGGGVCPVAAGARTQVMFRCGETSTDTFPEDWNWEWFAGDNTIVAYRIVS